MDRGTTTEGRGKMAGTLRPIRTDEDEHRCAECWLCDRAEVAATVFTTKNGDTFLCAPHGLCAFAEGIEPEGDETAWSTLADAAEIARA